MPRRNVFVFLALTLAFFARWEALSDGRFLNPDEAEILAMATRMSSNLWPPFESVSFGTIGVLTVAPFAILKFLRISITPEFAHVVTAAVHFVAVWMVWRQSIRWKPAWASVLLGGTVYLHFVQGGWPNPSSDWLHLSTSVPPLALCALILCVTQFQSEGASAPRAQIAVVSGLIMSLTKITFAPLAFVFVTGVTLLILRSGSRPVLNRVRSAFTPAVASLAMFLFVLSSGRGIRSNIIDSYESMFDYQGESQESLFSMMLEGVVALERAPMVAIFALGSVFWSASAVRVSNTRKDSIGYLMFVVLSALTTAHSVGASPYLFDHYLYLWVGFGLLNLAFVNLLLDDDVCVVAPLVRSPLGLEILHGCKRAAFVLLTLAIIAVSLGRVGRDSAGISSFSDSPWVEGEVERHSAALPNDPSEFSFFDACPRGARVIVWGWASEIYLRGEYVIGSRYINSNKLLEKFHSNREFYIAEFRREMEHPDLRCIIDATSVGAFHYDKADYAFNEFFAGDRLLRGFKYYEVEDDVIRSVYVRA